MRRKQRKDPFVGPSSANSMRKLANKIDFGSLDDDASKVVREGSPMEPMNSGMSQRELIEKYAFMKLWIEKMRGTEFEF